MNIRFTISLLLVAAVIAGGCSHTNNLAKYQFNGSRILFRVSASGAGSSFAGIRNPVDKNVITGIIAAIGTGVISAEGRKKLDNAVDRDTIAAAVAEGMKQSITDYLNVKPVPSIADDPDFLVETDLTDYQIVSLTEGLFVKAKGNSRMIHRATGAVVWENSESHTIPISRTYLAGLAPAPIASGVSIYNAVQLLNLSEEEIRTVMAMAASQAGKEIGETLREDIADMHAGK